MKQHTPLMKIAPLALLLSLLPAAAQVPTGHFQYVFTNPPLWDISGDYPQTGNASTGTVTLVQYATGQTAGIYTETYDDGWDHREMSASITGRVVSKPFVFGFRNRWHGTASGTWNGVPLLGNFTGRDTAILVPSSLTLQEELSIRICFVGARCVKSSGAGQAPLPSGMDGTWSLGLDTTAIGNKFGGSAVLTLSNGRTLSYVVQGSFNDTRQTGVLRLAGVGDALKTYLILTVAGQEMVVTKLRGRVLGQTLRLP